MSKTFSPRPIKISTPVFEEVTIFRMQLAITTGRGNDAGTDSGLSVKFNDRDDKFWLSKAIDNFEEGNTDVYDILSTSVKKIKDIHYIRFQNKGDDGIAIKKVQLFINENNVPIFVKEDPGRGMVTDDEKPYTISGAELRKYSGWRYNESNRKLWMPPNRISKSMLVNLIEAAIGHQITNSSDVGWGSESSVSILTTRWGHCVELNYVDEKTVHVDLDLKKLIKGPNPEIDVDFDLCFHCNNGIINTEVKNLKTGTNWVGEAQALIRDKVVKYIAKAIGSQVGSEDAGNVVGGLLSSALAFNTNFDPSNPNFSPSCSKIKVDTNCNINLR